MDSGHPKGAMAMAASRPHPGLSVRNSAYPKPDVRSGRRLMSAFDLILLKNSPQGPVRGIVGNINALRFACLNLSCAVGAPAISLFLAKIGRGVFQHNRPNSGHHERLPNVAASRPKNGCRDVNFRCLRAAVRRAIVEAPGPLRPLCAWLRCVRSGA